MIAEALYHWNCLEEFRKERERCKRYTYGRQWNDTINVDGRSMSEEEYIRSQGNIPLKNNLIRRIVRNVIGVFRNQYVPPSVHDLLDEDADNAIWKTLSHDRLIEKLELTSRRNDMEELLSRTMEEFLISGMAVHRKSMGYRNGVYGCWTDYVHPDYFFIDADMRDFRGTDASVVGEIHDVSFDEISCKLAKSPDEIEKLRKIYSIAVPPGTSFAATAEKRAGRCRVIEIWRKEMREHSLSKYKWGMEECWRYYFLSPQGDILAQGDSPYPDGMHPYVFKAYPFIDGEIHSFVADLIDQQRYINRLVTLYDWIMRASAKGVLLFPEDSLPDDVDIDEISAEWSRFNGVILFKPRPGMPLPQQVSGNATNIGITELLNVQLKMMEDVSGVNGALQGKLDSGSVSGTLYDQQTRHALTGLLDILQSYGSFIRQGFAKDASYLMTFSPEERI